MPITESTILSSVAQVDGRSYIVELHTDHEGKTYKVEYLADVGLDINKVMLARAVSMGAAIDLKAAARAEANNFKLPMYKYEFRQLFTQDEKEACDAFNRSFESNENLNDIQKAKIRSGLEDYAAAEMISLSNPFVLGMLSLYEAIGLLATGRAQEIIGGN